MESEEGLKKGRRRERREEEEGGGNEEKGRKGIGKKGEVGDKKRRNEG